MNIHCFGFYFFLEESFFFQWKVLNMLPKWFVVGIDRTEWTMTIAFPSDARNKINKLHISQTQFGFNAVEINLQFWMKYWFNLEHHLGTKYQCLAIIQFWQFSASFSPALCEKCPTYDFIAHFYDENKILKNSLLHTNLMQILPFSYRRSLSSSIIIMNSY